MLKFKATKRSAFLVGFSLSFAAVAFDIAHERALVSFTLDSPNVFPIVGIYFLVTGICFVIGPRVTTIKRVPWTGIPKDSEAWSQTFQVWGRMIFWFLGAMTGMVSLLPFKFTVTA